MKDLLVPHDLMSARSLAHCKQANSFACSSACIKMLTATRGAPDYAFIPTEQMPIYAARFGLFLQQILAPQTMDGLPDGTYLILRVSPKQKHWFIVRTNVFSDTVTIHDPELDAVAHYEMHDLPAAYHTDIMLAFKVWFTALSYGSKAHETV